MSETIEQQTARPSIDQTTLDAAVKETEKRLMDRPELLQMRMENETIMAECRVRPRNIEAMKDELASLLRAFPDLASEAIYNKPVGKDRNTGRMKYAVDLSIRAAEVLAEVYGFNRVRSDAMPIGEEGTRVKVDATFTDFQRGRIWQDGGIVSIWYKTSSGEMVKHSEDRFFNVIVKAEAAKRVREVILRSVNSALKAWFFNECKKVLSKRLTPEEEQRIIDSFSSIGVAQEQLDALIGRPRAMGWEVADRLLLQGIWSAVKAGETTVEQAFGKEKSGGAAEPPAGNGKGAAVDDLTGEQPTEPEPQVETMARPSWSESEVRVIDDCLLALAGINLDQTREQIASEYGTQRRICKGMRVEGKISDALLAHLLAEITTRQQKAVKPRGRRKKPGSTA